MILIPMSQQSILLCALCLGEDSLNGPSALALHLLIMSAPEARELNGLLFSSRNAFVPPHESQSFPEPFLRNALISASESLPEVLAVVMWLRLLSIMATLTHSRPSFVIGFPSLVWHFGGAVISAQGGVG